ncbi:MAG: hypothetical protein CSB15_00680 [Clostridiales bacterium]|nr:MAG: hypothetical protein CSB15_00680 [Clostridiales bacterium]
MQNVYNINYNIKNDKFKEFMSVLNGEKCQNNVDDNFINYIYEVIRLKKNGLLFFEKHIDRLNNTLNAKGYDFRVSYDEIYNYILELIKINGFYETNIKVVVTFEKNVPMILVKYIQSSYPKGNTKNMGVILKTANFQRVNPSSKVFTNDMKILREKLGNDDVFEYILINSENKVLECTKSNIFFYKDNFVYTAEDDKVLSGVTRSVVLDIVKSKYNLIYKSIFFDDIFTMDGAFITGTSLGVLPVSKVNSTVYDVDKIKFALDLSNAYEDKVNDYLLNTVFTGKL